VQTHRCDHRRRRAAVACRVLVARALLGRDPSALAGRSLKSARGAAGPEHVGHELVYRLAGAWMHGSVTAEAE
jgi:hypothetical protein